MEPEIGPWSTLEYQAIARETAATPSGSRFYLSSLPPALAADLPPALAPLAASGALVATDKDVETYSGMAKERICLLDPQAPAELAPEDGELFEWFVFGGILGELV